ncbi:MAG: acetylxylan esterase [Bryobacteraceae bacterium]
MRLRKLPSTVFAALLIGSPLSAASLSPPVHLTAQQDHRRMLNLLHIESLRPGADPHHPNAPNAVNYDESKVKPYTLPNALVFNDGQKVATPAMWWNKRRPQLVWMFNESMYGWIPAYTPKVNWQLAGIVHNKIGSYPVITKKLVGHVDDSFYPPIAVNIPLTLVTPANATGPVPVILEFHFVFPKGFKWPKGFHPPPPPPGPTPEEQILAKGWGYAELNPASYQADNGAGLTEGIIGLCNRGRPRRLDQWGTLRAWAWGASRALDYFETDKSVDAKRVAIEGLSRYGKAALVTMAFDQRFSIGLIGSSGEGGTKLSRRNFGELVANLAGSGEYHWMDGNFLKYAGPLTPDQLPVDANELIALCAPRPVFVSCGSPKVEGGWVDDRGQFEAEAAAGQVYRLLGKKGLGTQQMPPIGTALLSGDLAFRQHHGGHTVGPNWPYFLKWASRYWGGAQRP